MNRDEGLPAIEFLGVNDTAGSETHELVGNSGRQGARWWVLIAVAGLGAWFLGPGSSSGDIAPVADDTPSATVAPISPMLDNDQAIGGVDSIPVVESDQPIVVEPWPAPPRDRDPYVVRIPATEATPVGLDDVAIVYINESGDPTVVSFETGAVYRIDVAAVRVHETFAVEDGEVRSLGEANKGLPDATAGAVIFHTYRDVDPPGLGTVGDIQGRGRGPELCVSDRSCATPTPADGVISGVLVERFDPDRHPMIADVFDSWDHVDWWIVSPSGFRIPAPLDYIWVLTSLPL